MLRFRWLGGSSAVLVTALLLCTAGFALAQEQTEPDVITEPPPKSQSPPAQSAPIEPPQAAGTVVEVEKPVPRKEPPGRLRVGGGFGLGFGTGFLSVGVSPQVSYIFKRIVEPGVSLTYQFTKDSVTVPEIKWNTYGGSLFVRLYPVQMVFVVVEGELLNAGFRQGDFRSGRTNYGNLLLGGGFLMGVGRGAFVATSIKFPVFRNDIYPNAFPIISVGAGYSF